MKKSEELRGIKEERNIIHTLKRKEFHWIGHFLRGNCCLKHVTETQVERKLEAKETRGKRHKQLLDDLKEKVGCWKLKEEALDRTPWRTGFGRGCGLVARQKKE